jgi:hypothetical protein
MSLGSRATQVKPEALVILFRANPRNRFFMRMTLSPCAYAPSFPVFTRDFFGAAWTSRCTGALDGAESALQKRVGAFWRATINSNTIMSMTTSMNTMLML